MVQGNLQGWQAAVLGCCGVVQICESPPDEWSDGLFAAGALFGDRYGATELSVLPTTLSLSLI